MKHIKNINESVKVNISLTEDNFRTLISGGVVSTLVANIALQDIGFERIISIIRDEMSKI